MLVKRGLVLRKSVNKTYKVLTKSKVIHKRYKKILNRFKKVLIHDEFNYCQPGFNILIKKVRPISCLKN